MQIGVGFLVHDVDVGEYVSFTAACMGVRQRAPPPPSPPQPKAKVGGAPADELSPTQTRQAYKLHASASSQVLKWLSHWGGWLNKILANAHAQCSENLRGGTGWLIRTPEADRATAKNTFGPCSW